jgi:aminoglycoside phosphotransferase (APT) family kinase protein
MTIPAGSDDPSDALLEHLRTVLECPALRYAQAPRPLSGGFDTRIFAFRLAGAPVEYAGRLIVRIFRDARGPARAAAEEAHQNVIAGAGYPVPRVLHACLDATVAGGAFTVMALVPGTTLLDAALRPSTMMLRLPGLLAEAHARLHAIDPGPIVLALEKAGAPALAGRTAQWLAPLRSTAETPGLEGMLPGLEWLERNHPRGDFQPAILHLDFHPANVLVEHGKVTGVVDWANAGLGDPAADVATTTVLMTMGPVDLPRFVRRPMGWLRKWLARRYVANYRSRRAVPGDSLRYYQALRCYGAMLQVAATRNAHGSDDDAPREAYVWGTPAQVAMMTSRFLKVSGVPLVLPPE